MTTTELIELLKKHERGGATGRPREVMFEVDDRIIDTDGIEVIGSGDGLITELYLSLPSAEPRWIPVAERLPEEDENVLAWVKEADACGDNAIIAAWSWHDMEDSFFNKIGTRRVWHTDQYYYEFDEIAAWMPLPQPWKGADDEID